jgi:lysophospholipase L1-like esterase
MKAGTMRRISTTVLLLACGLAPREIRADDAYAGLNVFDKTNSAFVPKHKWMRRHEWLKRHESFVDIARQDNFDLLFIGDSLTDFWRTRGKAVWERNFGPLRAENFGISGDRTQNVFWRVQHGELDGTHPKLVVLLIGTDNSQSDSAENIATGITAIVKEIRARCPATKVLLLAIFPRADTPDETERDKISQKIRDTNKIIASLDDGTSIKYLDIGPKFADSSGALQKRVMPDFLHPNDKGYQIWADAILPTVNAMMR